MLQAFFLPKKKIKDIKLTFKATNLLFLFSKFYKSQFTTKTV